MSAHSSTMSSTHRALRPAIAVALAIVEYMLFSFTFDAHELVPAAWKLGDLAPMPVIVGVAYVILRAASGASAAPPTTTAATAPSPVEGASRGLVVAPLVAHALAFAVFFAVALRVRGAGDVAMTFGWLGLGAVALVLLAVFALTGLGFRAAVERARAPLLLGAGVGVAAWAAGRGTGELWHPLARLTLQPVAALVQTISGDLVVDPARFLVGAQDFVVRIDPSCSGYEGMGFVAVLVGAYVWTQRATLRFPHALALPVVAVLLAFAANVVRITALIYVGKHVSADVAVNGFHSKAGWLLYCAVALGVVFAARRVRVLQSAASLASEADGAGVHENPTAGYLAGLLALVLGSLGAGLFSDGKLSHLELASIAAASIAIVATRRTVRDALAGTTRAWGIGAIVGVAVFVVWMGLDAFTASDAATQARAATAEQLAAWPRWRAALWIATRVMASVLVVPLVEELAFRGFLMRRIVDADFTAVDYRKVTALAVAVSSIAFGALHALWLGGIAAGIAYALVVRVTGELRAAVAAHVVTNALIAVAAVAFGRWDLW